MSEIIYFCELINLEEHSPWLEQYIDELQDLIGLEEALKLMRYKCNKHKESDPCDNIPDPVTMTGGYHAALCLSHRNEWRQVVNNTPLWRDMHVVKSKLEANIHSGITNNIEKLTDDLMFIEQKLWQLSISWINEGKTEEEIEKNKKDN